jgi:hypothetical protein
LVNDSVNYNATDGLAPGKRKHPLSEHTARIQAFA